MGHQESEIIYAIGDIHGNLDALQSLMKKVEDDVLSRKLRTKPTLVFLGDYIDRGQQSKEVVDFLISDKLSSFDTRFVRGNHDAAFSHFLSSTHDSVGLLPCLIEKIRDYGSEATQVSYGVQPPSLLNLSRIREARRDLCTKVPERHKEFLENLENCYITEKYVFVHAGLRPDVPLAEQSKHDMLLIGSTFLDSKDKFEGRVVIHGHKRYKWPKLRANRISIDTGAYETDRLTCVVLSDQAPQFIFSETPKSKKVGRYRQMRLSLAAHYFHWRQQRPQPVPPAHFSEPRV
jgi:serine/threonine protein phosphatase 1